MPQLFSNNARALLTSGIGAADTSLVVEAAKADLFPTANTGASPVPAGTDWFKVTLQDSSGNVEIMYVRTRSAGSGVMSNVIRGQEGTTARTFTAGTVVGLRVTAADLQSALGVPGLNNTFSGNNSFTGSNSFAQSPTVPTPTYGANNTQAASTAFVQAALQAIYPVGSVYINAAVTTNPATLLGFGTWAEIGAGRVLVGQDVGDTSFDTMGETGGSKISLLPSHTHNFSTTTNSAGTHNHTLSMYSSPGDNPLGGNTYISTDGQGPIGPFTPTYLTMADAGAHTHTLSGITDAAGQAPSTGNLQPYIVVKMWQRTA